MKSRCRSIGGTEFPLGLGCLIWLRHVLDAEAGTRGMRRAIVDWNDFLSDPRLTLGRVGEQLGVVWPRWSDGVLAEIDEFVSADMRRQRASDSDLQVASRRESFGSRGLCRRS